MRLKGKYGMMMMAHLMTPQLQGNNMKDEERAERVLLSGKKSKSELAKSKGLKHFSIDGNEVFASNLKNALRKLKLDNHGKGNYDVYEIKEL